MTATRRTVISFLLRCKIRRTKIVKHNMVLFQPITLNGESIGTIFIEADLTDLRERLTRFLEIDFLVLLVSLGGRFPVVYSASARDLRSNPGTGGYGVVGLHPRKLFHPRNEKRQ
jgi:hypothetical protein